MLENLRCTNCKSSDLIDEHYQIVCASCGFCDSTEPIPSVGRVEEAMQGLRIHHLRDEAGFSVTVANGLTDPPESV